MKPIKSIALTALSLGAATIGAASHYCYKISVGNKRRCFSPEINAHEQSAQKWIDSQKSQQVSVLSHDHLTLIGHYISAPTPTDQTVIIAHGYNSYGKEMIKYATFFTERLGYNVLIPDARGHGESGGNYIGFGWHERLDYLKWIDYLIQDNPSVKIALFGVSMGGATVMMVSGEALPPQVKAIIEDCGYTTAHDELSYQFKQRYNLPNCPLLHTTSLLTKIRNGYSFSEASALEQVRKASVPMFFIHGALDDFVPTTMVYRLYKQCSSPHKAIWVVPGAEHGSSLKVAGDTYITKVQDFLNKYM